VELRRNARVHNDKYQLSGDFITSDLKDGSVSKVVAQTNARLVSDRLTVSGPQLQLFFERDLLQRMVSGQVPGAAPPRDTARAAAAARPGLPPGAVLSAADSARLAAPRPPAPARAAGDTASAPAVLPNASPREALPPGFRSIAVSKGFRMEADSLEAILPEQRLRRVNAVGSARGESWDTLAVRTVKVDSGGAAGVVPAAPTSMTEPPQAIDQKDVLTADTIIAFFRDTLAADSAAGAAPRDSVRLAGRPVTPPPAPSDTSNTEIERLLAIGNAHSLYRMRDSTQAEEKKPGLNYLIGDRIDLTFKAGEVDVAHVQGLKQGMYLDPDAVAGDTLAADTSAAGRRAGGANARPPAATPATTTGTVRPPAATAAPPTAPTARPAPPASPPARPAATPPARPIASTAPLGAPFMTTRRATAAAFSRGGWT
jgi:hypothetical protein